MRPNAKVPPYLLAAQAGSVVRHLFSRLRAGESVSPADLSRTIGALQQLAGDLAHVLPSLQGQLEENLLAGRIGAGDTAGEAWDKVADVGHALAQAQANSLVMATELRASQRVLGELTSS
ncbi:hypothetical protein AB0N89_28980 [Amycolatopsis sp. NPDC089917]|uniref:hypothetical protein n=1 Tax=Amycolatopsis sp. NPDC089917 TaxID=3155187 RepID=UPI0034272E4E